MRSPVPKRGDVIYLNFHPQAGHEQDRRGPALVLSTVEYNKKTGLCLVCPITSNVKGYPFEVIIPDGFSIHGVVLADQVKSIDWKVREAEFVAVMPAPIIEDVLDKIADLLEM